MSFFPLHLGRKQLFLGLNLVSVTQFQSAELFLTLSHIHSEKLPVDCPRMAQPFMPKQFEPPRASHLPSHKQFPPPPINVCHILIERFHLNFPFSPHKTTRHKHSINISIFSGSSPEIDRRLLLHEGKAEDATSWVSLLFSRLCTETFLWFLWKQTHNFFLWQFYFCLLSGSPLSF